MKRKFLSAFLLIGLLGATSCSLKNNDSNIINDSTNAESSIIPSSINDSSIIQASTNASSSNVASSSQAQASSQAASSSSAASSSQSASSSQAQASSNQASSSLAQASTIISSSNNASSSSQIEEIDSSDNVIKLTDYKGYNEGAYAIFESEDTNINNFTVSYTTNGIDFVDIDSELIRFIDNKYRADILGLKAGNYIIRIKNNNTNSIVYSQAIKVSADDRSGYAHFNYTNGVGAYNNDGTLKDNAIVVYVSDSNKNTVTAKIGSNTYTGLVNIIKNANKDYPLDIRILDDIKTCQFNKKTFTSTPKTLDLINEQAQALGNTKQSYSAAQIINNGWNSYSDDLNNGITELNNLSSNVSYGGNSHNTSAYSNAFDTAWNMCNISSKENITIEGIGTDAGIFQWGFSFSSCKSIEVKNLRFHNYTEDAVGIEGGNNFWLHNVTFDIGVNNWDFSDEQDKSDGDGATDFKKASNLTIAYCRYNKTHKTNLIGGDNKNLQWNVTLHHNFYNQCSSRLPLGRQANMHFYNNYYYNCSTCQDIRANAFVLSEYNYFDNCSNPQKITIDSTYTGTVIKSYNDILNNCGSSAATKVTDRTTALDGNCNGGAYNNFDTNSSLFYYDTNNQKSNVSILNNANEVPSLIPLIAGSGVLNSFELYDSDNTEIEIDEKETFEVQFNSNGGSSVSTQYISEGNKINYIKPTKNGYKFLGWYLEDTLTNRFDENDTVNSNLILYANWEESNTSLEILTFDGFDTGTLSQNTTIDNITLITGKTITIYDLDKSITIEDTEITKNVKLGGSGSYSSAAIQFTTDKISNITIYYAGGNADRVPVLYNSNGEVARSNIKTTGETNVLSYTFEDIEAGTYSIASSNSSMFFYAIIIEY